MCMFVVFIDNLQSLKCEQDVDRVLSFFFFAESSVSLPKYENKVKKLDAFLVKLKKPGVPVNGDK